MRLVDGKGLRAAFRKGGIAFVNVVGHVGKEQRRAKGRGAIGIYRCDMNGAALNRGQDIRRGG
jgi:hypothetical protein